MKVASDPNVESEKERKLKDRQDNKEELDPSDALNSPEKSDVIPETRMKKKFTKKVGNNDKFVGEDDPIANSDVKTDEYNDSTNVDPTLTGQNFPNDVDPDFNEKDPRYDKSMDQR
ncbi:hypothetical protein TNCT_479371 [Trichonephila clavata]|nr:hypothetical protein TNCT_479371 [Trichonephila clavata]